MGRGSGVHSGDRKYYNELIRPEEKFAFCTSLLKFQTVHPEYCEMYCSNHKHDVDRFCLI